MAESTSSDGYDLEPVIEWKLLSHRFIPSGAAAAMSSSSLIVGNLDLYITSKHRIMIIRDVDVDFRDYDATLHLHQIRLLVLLDRPDVANAYLLDRLDALGVEDSVSRQDIATCFLGFVYDAANVDAREVYVRVGVDVTSIVVIHLEKEATWEWGEEEEEEPGGSKPTSVTNYIKDASFADGVASGITCSICMEDMLKDGDNIRRLRQLPCTHVFHDSCIIPWLERSRTCPLCRRELVQD